MSTRSKRVTARVSQKHAPETDWSKAINFTPLPAEIIIYEPDETVPVVRGKIGNGQTKINDLPFCGIGVGANTSANGEIFNDYENNVAGAKCFNILDLNNKKDILTLDSIQGLEIDQEISLVLNANYDFYRTISSVDTVNNTIQLNEALPNEWGTTMSTDPTKNKLWIPAEPQLGTTILASYAHTQGVGNIACNEGSHSEGGYNITSGKYGHTEGRRNKAGFAAHAQNEDNKAIGNFSSAGGKGNIATVTAQDVIGTYNKINHDAIAIIGNGKSDTERNNALEVLKDGSATLDKQGFSANSILRKDYLDSKIGTTETVEILALQENKLSNNLGDSPIINLQVTPSNSTSNNKIVVSDSYNLISIDLSKFTYNFNGYPAITAGGLTLYYKNNKLYLVGKYTAADYKQFVGIAKAELIGGITYTSAVYDKTVGGIGFQVVASGIGSGVMDITMGATSAQGISFRNYLVTANTTATINLNVKRDISFKDQEVRFIISEGSVRNFAPFGHCQVLSLPEEYSEPTLIENYNLVSYQDDMYIYSSIPCSFDYLINRQARTEEQVDNLNEKVNILSSTGLTREIVRYIPLAHEAKENVIYMVGPSQATEKLLIYSNEAETLISYEPGLYKKEIQSMQHISATDTYYLNFGDEEQAWYFNVSDMKSFDYLYGYYTAKNKKLQIEFRLLNEWGVNG